MLKINYGIIKEGLGGEVCSFTPLSAIEDKINSKRDILEVEVNNFTGEICEGIRILVKGSEVANYKEEKCDGFIKLYKDFLQEGAEISFENFIRYIFSIDFILETVAKDLIYEDIEEEEEEEISYKVEETSIASNAVTFVGAIATDKRIKVSDGILNQVKKMHEKVYEDDCCEECVNAMWNISEGKFVSQRVMMLGLGAMHKYHEEELKELLSGKNFIIEE